MKYIIFILLLLNFQCVNSSKSPKYKKPLTFDNLNEIYTLNEDEREPKLIKEGFVAISKSLNGETFVKNHDTCKSEIIYFSRFDYAMEYYLQGTTYRDNYDNIKKEVETKGFLYLTTKRVDNDLFSEIYGDTINNKTGLLFSILPLSDSSAKCQDEQFRIRFFNKNLIN